MQGRVVQVSAKPETPGERGLPKAAVPEARVTKEGLVGDFNRYRAEKLARDPDSAVLVMPLETLRELNREGWAVQPGDLGENVTTIGIPYDAFAVGTRWRAGEVEFEVTRPCEPCSHVLELDFLEGEYAGFFVKALKDRRGWYARVLAEGVVRAGDPVKRL